MPAGEPTRFILLPTRGTRAGEASSLSTRRFLADLPGAAVPLRVVDSVRPDGPKLVEMTPEAAVSLRAAEPGVRLVPLVYYRSAQWRPEVQTQVLRRAVGCEVSVVSRAGHVPIADALVVGFTDYAAREGVQASTDASGTARLPLPSGTRLQRLYVYPRVGHWGILKRGVTLARALTLPLRPIDITVPDALRRRYGAAAPDAGSGVKVAVIDTGVGPHPSLAPAAGECTVPGEPEGDWADVSEGHGTHVAGIIAAEGELPGLAPGCALYAYRAFPKGGGPASNYAIAKAVDRAVEAGCDLVNLSLGGGQPDEALQAAIADARLAGTLVLVANGNDDRGPVSFPASYALSVAVSACGRKGTFPAGATQAGDVAAPFGSDPADFVAAFSNVGPPTDLTAPGVGIVSTVPGGYAAMDGTSMACPAAAGRAAALLSALPDILAQPRTAARSEAIAQALYRSAHPLGFGPEYEGQGVPG